MPAVFQLVIDTASPAVGFQLVLDTTPPQVEWGPPPRAVAGTVLRLSYTSDEPIAVAELHLADGRYLPMAVGALELSVLLPPDAADGPAGVRVADDVGNSIEYPAVAQIAGVIVEPEPTAGGLPSRARRRPRPQRRTVRGAAAIASSTSSARIRAHTVTEPTVARSRSAARVRSSLASSSTAAARSRAVITARLQSAGTAAIAGDGGARVRRGDGQSIEALALLGVL